MLIDATHAEETRVVVVDGNKVEEFDFETVNKRQLQGNIYLAKITRVEPSLQAAFVDYGGNRHGFLAFAEIHPDYYQIPVADRRALLEEERAMARSEDDEDNGRSRRRPSPKPRAAAASADPSVTASITGMDVVDLGDEAGADTLVAAPETAPREADEAEPAYNAMDHASDTDSEIESVAEEDVAEEISQPRRPKPRRYKIQEVVKVRQIMLVQVVKEERGNKGAALTTYLSLAGRYCVLMPNTARGGGISRKITNAADRKKLKEIAGEIEVPEGAGLIVRTAGAKRTKAEIVRDYEYLMRLWEEIRELTLKSIAPAPIYEEGNLIKRSIRDLFNREIDEVLVEGEAGYRTAKDFMKMILPSHARDVKRYDEAMPLFTRFQVESYLGGMFNPTVQLKSGGYIVIGVTEALVAIDVNSGRATKEGNIEDTALKTNLEASDEIARQLRLRDLAGLIVIDFIDMEERKNNAAVEKRLKERLKTDRARIQVGRISGFGLMEMSRQRLRPGMLESTTQPCQHCHGTGLIRSDDSMALTILRALEEEGTRKRSREVLLKAPVTIVNFLINQKREHVALIEGRYGMSVRIEADPRLVSPDYAIEKFKTATRPVPEASRVISGNASLMGEVVEEEEEDLPAEDEAEETPATGTQADASQQGEGGAKKKRRRRRRGRGKGGNGQGQSGSMSAMDVVDEDEDEDEDGEDEGEGEDDGGEDDRPATPAAAEAAPVTGTGTAEPEPAGSEGAAAAAPSAPVKRTRAPRATKAKPGAKVPDRSDAPLAETAQPPEAAEAPVTATSAAAKPGARKPAAAKPATAKAGTGKSGAAKSGPAKARAGKSAAADPEPSAAPEPARTPETATAAPFPSGPGDAPAAATGPMPDPSATAASGDAEAASDPKPRRKGWWSLAR